MAMAAIGVLLFSTGSFLASNYFTRSTYYCFELTDSRNLILALQIVALPLDAAIIVSSWRILSWTRTIKLRLRTIGTLLMISAVAVGIVGLCSTVYTAGFQRPRVAIGTLYAFDIIFDSIVFAVLLSSAALWICDTSPMVPAHSITILFSLWTCFDNAFRFGDWMHYTRSGFMWPLWITTVGAVWFIYAHGVRSILRIHRIIAVPFLLSLVLIATCYALFKSPMEIKKRHPIKDMIYKSRIQHNSWMTEAATSQNLRTAVTVYEERQSGRCPPPSFSEWWDYAQGTVILDEFPQIDRDMKPFWGLSPQVLRDRADAAAASPGVFSLIVADGNVTHADTGDADKNKELDDFSAVISKFSRHLPDMVIPINLGRGPRVLPSWEAAHAHDKSNLHSMVGLISKRSDLAMPGNVSHATTLTPRNDEASAAQSGLSGFITASEHREMLIQACHPASKSRTAPHWDIAEFCWNCVRRASRGPLTKRWSRLLDTCDQPDIKHLHGQYLTQPTQPPFHQLVPLFSLSKTDAFSDIIIPAPKSGVGEPDIKWDFKRRYDGLHWKEPVGQKALTNHGLKGHHIYRLLHLLKYPSPDDKATLILRKPARAGEKFDRYKYESATARQAADALPFDVALGDYSACEGEHCALIKQAYGEKPGEQEPLEYRYVLLLDEDDGPPVQLMRTLRSASVPFLSTIFRAWYTDRLQPWQHFVPIDPRYQGLHATYMYFVGTKDRAVKVNGREIDEPPQLEDAEGIAEEGRKWATKAIGEKDMEAYMFRLLLEWGRLIDDRREVIGFRKSQEGFENTGWTKRQDAP